MIEVSLSVHELVDFVLRTGSIDTRYFNLETMQEGTRLHNIYQSKQGPNYISELPLSGYIVFDEYNVFLHGRADGIIVEDDKVIIEEIKTTNMPLEKFFEENRDWHLGQAVCYGYLYCKEHDVDEAGVCLTYISQVDEGIIKKSFKYTFQEFKNALIGYLLKYLNFQRILTKRHKEMVESFKKYSFPFESKRKGQDELISSVDEALKTKEIYFIEASTGIGKTISTIYGTFDEIANERLNKVFYLCPKNSGFDSSINAFKILCEGKFKFIASTLSAKEKECPFKLDRPCTPKFCPYAENFYYREREALFEIIANESIIDLSIIRYYSEKHKICPFEFNLDVLLYSDFIVCDLNYVFNPTSYLKRFFEMPDKTYFSAALVDESHNFLSRTRDMYSISLSYEDFKTTRKIYDALGDKKIKNLTKNINHDFRLFESIEEDDFEMEVQQFDETFIKHLKKLRELMLDYKEKNPDFNENQCRVFSLNLKTFLDIYQMVDETFVLYIKKEENDLNISIQSIDPSKFVRERLSQFESAVFFSATLTPFEFYENTILGRNNVKSLAIPSPFDPDNFKVMVNNTLSVKYKDRESTISDIAKQINAYVNCRIGNYLVFVPSFAYLELLRKYFYNDERFVFQEKNMSANQTQEFLEDFKIDPEVSRVGVCVLGGSFSEGIDLIGSRLIGAVIVGVGIPQINKENDRIKEYYDSIELNGFEFSYTYPGINKVMQAMGRVIRTKDDKGSVLLIDNRLLWQKYKDTILKNRPYVVVKNENDIEKELKTFYKK